MLPFTPALEISFPRPHFSETMFSHTSQPCTFERDCEVVMIPMGDEVTIPAGTVGYITQALGGSFTVFVDGNLFRIAGINADAIGKTPVMPLSLPENATEEDVERLLWDQMKTVYDPEIPVNIVDLGLVYDCATKLDESGRREVSVTMTLTAPGCGMGDILVDDVRSKLKLVPTVVQVDVELTFEPLWNHSMMSEVARLETGMF
jgi:probable FeS assembly SUF system protein SufT